MAQLTIQFSALATLLRAIFIRIYHGKGGHGYLSQRCVVGNRQVRRVGEDLGVGEGYGGSAQGTWGHGMGEG